MFSIFFSTRPAEATHIGKVDRETPRVGVQQRATRAVCEKAAAPVHSPWVASSRTVSGGWLQWSPGLSVDSLTGDLQREESHTGHNSQTRKRPARDHLAKDMIIRNVQPGLETTALRGNHG